MSVADFSAALKNKALKEWFAKEVAGGGSASKSVQEAYRQENVNVLANPVTLYRAGEQTSEKTSFLITKDTVRDLIVQFHGIEDATLLDELTDTYFATFRSKDAGVKVSRRKITVGDGLPAVYFPEISFDTITKLVNNVMNIKSGDLAKYYEKGHVVGLATELLQVTSNRIAKVDTTGSYGKSFLLSQLDKVIDYYRRLDLDSANIQPAADIKVYASVNKSISKNGTTKYLVELQPKAANQASAREVQATLPSIRKLFSPGNITEKALISIIEKLQEAVSDPKFQQDLLDMKSSPSYKDMLAEVIAGAISGNPKEFFIKHDSVFLLNYRTPKVNTTEIRKAAKKEIAKAKTLKAKLDKKGKLESIQPPLSSLQLMFDAMLTQRIKQNMGSGNAKDVLNLRSGRFAESVKVERLSMSRAGMLSVFYTYMKNPYATFSQGGMQQYPRSRDPKALISKSIREIAQEQAITRLRAIVV